jgi:hypothetical protein
MTSLYEINKDILEITNAIENAETMEDMLGMQ